MEAKHTTAPVQINETLFTTEARIEQITNASMKVMADFATRSTPYARYSAVDVAEVVMTDPTGDAACFLARLVADSILAVATFDHVRCEYAKSGAA